MNTSLPITVVGGGATGHAAAADLTLAGFKVCLLEEPALQESLYPAVKAGGVTLKGAGRTGLAKVKRITTDAEEALKISRVVLVAVIARRHEAVARLIAPHLRDDHAVLIMPGNVGSVVMANIWTGMEIRSKAVVADWESSYACRLTGPAEVTMLLPPRPKYVAAYPARETPRMIQALQGIYETMPARNVFEATLNSPNVDTHLMASLLNTGAIEKARGDYRLYAQGLTPSVIRCIEALHEEKVVLFKALGYTDRSRPESIKKAAEPEKYPELDLLITARGPDSMQHRYIEESARVGASLMISLGEMMGIPTPFSNAMVTLASTIDGVDYLKEGRTLENLGFGGMGPEELNRVLAEGKGEDAK